MDIIKHMNNETSRKQSVKLKIGEERDDYVMAGKYLS
jgi:hypothetical protein